MWFRLSEDGECGDRPGTLSPPLLTQMESAEEQRKAKAKAYYEANKARILERARKYREAHREELNDKQKAYYQQHKEESKEWREAHREKAKEYHNEHKEERNRKAREYYRKRKEAKKSNQKTEEAQTEASPSPPKLKMD